MDTRLTEKVKATRSKMYRMCKGPRYRNKHDAYRKQGGGTVHSATLIFPSVKWEQLNPDQLDLCPPLDSNCIALYLLSIAV